MKNNIDYIYEYSDLNLFQTRVKVLTGHYADLVLEFGGSGLEQSEGVNNFHFTYTLYAIPERLSNYKLRGTPDFEQFLSDLLIDIIDDRRNDPDMIAKLDNATGDLGPVISSIMLAPQFYSQNTATVI